MIYDRNEINVCISTFRFLFLFNFIYLHRSWCSIPFKCIQLCRSVLGKSYINLSTLIPLTCIYTCFMILGILGNLATVVVILSNKSMKSPTNIYLTNLAVADIFTLSLSKSQISEYFKDLANANLGMPSELFLMWRQYPWPFGEYACDAKIVISETFINASILIVVALTCER